MRDDFKDVRAFHVKFKLPVDDGGPPEPMSPEILAFRMRFLHEERIEYIDAFDKRNLTKAVDALIDFVYVAFGTALFMKAAQTSAAYSGEQWPTFDRVRKYAQDAGYPLQRSPSLPPWASHEMMTTSLLHSVKMFELAHVATTDEPRMIFLALKQLQAAASYAYLAAVMMGIPWPECWKHVQAANMRKIRAAEDGSNSKRASPWDVVKPGGWTAPDAEIYNTLRLHGALLEVR